MVEGEERGLIIDPHDWIWFVAGGLATLVALYLIKNILEPSGQHHYHQDHHHYPKAVPISKEVEKVYKMDYDGKMY